MTAGVARPTQSASMVASSLWGLIYESSYHPKTSFKSFRAEGSRLSVVSRCYLNGCHGC